MSTAAELLAENQRRKENASRAASDWTREHPSGTPVLAWPGVREGEPLRTRTRSSAFVIGVDDVVVAVAGHAGGIAITHVDHDPTRQPAVPDIEFQMPACPICDASLNSDGDALVCSRCHVSWAGNGTNGEWMNPDALQCKATAKPYHLIESDAVRCILHRGHDVEGEEYSGTHQTGDFTSWTDDDSRALTDSDGEAL